MKCWSPNSGLGAVFLESLCLSIFLDKRIGEKKIVDRKVQRFEKMFGEAFVLTKLDEYVFLYGLLGHDSFFSFLRRQTRMPDEFFSYVAEQLGVPPLEGGNNEKTPKKRARRAS